MAAFNFSEAPFPATKAFRVDPTRIASSRVPFLCHWCDSTRSRAPWEPGRRESPENRREELVCELRVSGVWVGGEVKARSRRARLSDLVQRLCLRLIPWTGIGGSGRVHSPPVISHPANACSIPNRAAEPAVTPLSHRAPRRPVVSTAVRLTGRVTVRVALAY